MLAVPVRLVEDNDGRDVLDASLALAQTQLVGQLADETSLNARTMGTLGFAGALLAADIAAKDVLGAAWWTPLVAIGLATACCLVPALGLGLGFAYDTDLGPDAASFYSAYRPGPSRPGREQLLADLSTAFARNARRLRAKRTALRIALVVLTVGLASSAAAIDVMQPTTIRTTYEHERPEA